MAVSEKHLKRAADNEQERENAYICLFCTKAECTGADACFREQKKQRARKYQADRRAAQRALDAFYAEQYAKDRREKLAQAKEAFDRKHAAQ